ncbi:MAG TPA: hypothetical protein VGM32_10445 [Rhodopila sp.]|jgi:hypothetical protein
MNCLRFAAKTGILIAGLVVWGCTAGPPGGQAQADADTRAACRQRAEQAYEQQNRGEIYSPPSQVNTPYSASYEPGVSGRGLSELFAHDRMISDCVRNTGTGAERSQSGP